MSRDGIPSRPLRWMTPADMASDAVADQDADTSVPDGSRAHARRKPAKRKGPPQLQFVTATDPSDFKREKAKRSVRSQAMMQYRYQSAEQKKQKTRDNAAGPSQSVVTQKSRVRDHSFATLPLNATAKHSLEMEREEDAILHNLLGTKMATSCIGNTMDPFLVIPKFKNPVLNSNQLVRSCNRIFVSKQTLARWVPAMLAHPHILLSSTIMSSTWKDMVEGLCGESRRTILLKAEIISWINERLQDPVLMFHDDTIMVILHLLMGETWSCNEKTLHIHMSGIARLMAARADGVLPLTFDTVGIATAIICAHVPIICESTPLPQLCSFQAPDFTADSSAALPESPLYCPREHMYSVVADPACSAHTYHLLCVVRDLTDLFLAYSNDVTSIMGQGRVLEEDRFRHLSIDYDVKVAQFRTKLASMPSASVPGLPTTNDWIYEACRITGWIHASAIITCTPFSRAADPDSNAIMRTAAPTSGEAPGRRLTETLYEVLERTNTGDLWNSMAGVFYWVCTVGSAAARTPVTVNECFSRPSSQSEAYCTWVKRCLTMFSSRTLSHMIFEHPLPLLATQRKLLRIQELIGRNDALSQASQAFVSTVTLNT